MDRKHLVLFIPPRFVVRFTQIKVMILPADQISEV